MSPGRRVQVVFGRGGVRGIALAGAAAAFEEQGYRMERVAGVSAGALVAALVAAGYRAPEIRRIVGELDYAGLRDASGYGRLPLVGPVLTLFTRMGLYGGDALLETFRELLAARGVRTFGDLRAMGGGPARCGRHGSYRLRVVAADVTRRRLIVLPDDASDYGIAPDTLDVALALRMSASVPFYFEPVRFGADPPSLVVDGGLLASIPFALLDDGLGQGPMVGVEAGPGERRRLRHHEIRGPLALLAASYYTALAANGRCNRSAIDAARTVDIDCGDVGAVDFGIDGRRQAQLFDAGRSATLAFLARSPEPLLACPEGLEQSA